MLRIARAQHRLARPAHPQSRALDLEGDRGDIGLAVRGDGGQAGQRLGSEVVELVVGESHANIVVRRLGWPKGERELGESFLVGLRQRPRRGRGSGSVPAFWGTVESLSRLTNASSALASAVHA